MFWEEVKKERKGRDDRRVGIKDINGDMLVNDEKVNKRWGKYFKDLLNVDDKKKVIVVGIGIERRSLVCKRCNDKIGYDEFCGVVKKLKGKLPGE